MIIKNHIRKKVFSLLPLIDSIFSKSLSSQGNNSFSFLLPSEAVEEERDRDNFFDNFSIACGDFDLPLFIDDDDDLARGFSSFLDDDPMPGEFGLPLGVSPFLDDPTEFVLESGVSPFLDDDPMSDEENDVDRDNVLCLVAFL
jgi:hypothetical protein